VTNTVSTQYNLPCGINKTQNLFSIGFFGFFCAQLYSGIFADKFGRKPMMLFSMAMMAITLYLVAYFNESGINIYTAGVFFKMFFCFHGILGYEN